MAKITLDSILSGFQTVSQVSSNNSKIEDELNDKVLYRDNPTGEANQMLNELDMNSQRIINLPSPIADQEPARWIDVKNGVSTIVEPVPSQVGNAKVPLTTNGTSLQFGPVESDQVDFLQAGTGAVSRTLESRFNEYVSIKDYGATGDGATDDSAAIQAAFDFGSANNIPVYVPTGTYILNGTRQGPNAAIVTIASNLTVFGAGFDSKFKVADGYTTGGDYRVFAPADTTTATNNIDISGINVDGNGLNNLVLGSTGGDIRRAYAINLLLGDNIYLHSNWVTNNPGRNGFNIGDNSNPASFTNVRVLDNKFVDMGGAIVGNGLQNDHSSIYLQTDGGMCSRNTFFNTVQPDPFTSPTKTINALEIHGSNTLVQENRVHNYTGGGNLVATVHDSINNTWSDNHFTGMTSNVLVPFIAGGFENKRLTIRNNIINIDNTTFNGGTGIFQNPATAVTSDQLEDLVIEDNLIYGSLDTPQATTWHGISLVAVKNCSVRRNRIINIQGDGVDVSDAVSLLDIQNLAIEDNEFENCGIHTPVSRIWGVRVETLLTDRVFDEISIQRNNVTAVLPAVSATPKNSRGLRVKGPGALRNVTIKDNTFKNIQRSQRYDINTPTNNINVYIVPSITTHAKATPPVSGQFEIGRDITYFSDPTVAGSIGNNVTVSGSASEATWAGTTAYLEGQWIVTSGGKVMECIVSGTSSGVEPTPTILLSTFVDGTVTWVLRDTATAILSGIQGGFLEFSTTFDPPSLADGVGTTKNLAAPAVVLGDYVDGVSFTNDLQGITVTAYVSATNIVTARFQNETGGVLDLASGTLRFRVTRP